jgi:hypothetical protein
MPMATTASSRASPLLLSTIEWWRGIARARKIGVALVMVTACLVLYICDEVSDYIEKAYGTQRAASTALYMDGVVEPLVQELAIQPNLSEKNRAALTQALAPGTIGKPIVAFKIWVGDRIVFSNHGQLIGNKYRPVSARDRAYAGEVVAKFELDSEDDELERALHAPIVETHAPIRQTGTQKIIAVAETSELAWELQTEIHAAQYASYAVTVTLASALLFAFFNFSGRGTQGGTQLAHPYVRENKLRLYSANCDFIETTDLQMRRIGKRLQTGPMQHVAFALMKLDEMAGKLPHEEIALVTRALQDCVADLRDMSAGFGLTEIESLSLSQVLSLALWMQKPRGSSSVACDFSSLPNSTPYALKACAYLFVEESLTKALESGPSDNAYLAAKCIDGNLYIELCYELEKPASKALAQKQVHLASKSLLGRIDSLGGTMHLHADGRRFHASAAFNLRDIGD